MDIINVIGFLAAVISFVLFIPQAQRVWKYRNHPVWLQGLSIWTQVFVLMNASLWGVYAVVTGSFWVGAPGLVNAPLALIMIFLISKAHKAVKNSGSDVSDVCVLCVSDVDHNVIILSGDNSGSVVSCSGLISSSGVVVRSSEDVEKVLSVLA